MSIGAAATSPARRLAGLSARSPVRHVTALLAVAGAVVVLELRILDLDHGTHLLVILTLVVGVALLFGPRLATTALVVGAVVSTAASMITVDGVFDTPHAYIQVLTYLATGTAFIVLVPRAGRSRQPPRAPTVSAPPLGQHGLVEPLTPRECQVLRLAATGVSVEEMARQLFVSPNTVKTHLTHVYAKLGCRGRSDAVRVALHCGCLTPADICPHHCADGAEKSPVPVMSEHPNR